MTAYCKTFFETKLIPKLYLFLFFNKLAITIPIIIPKTGPPTSVKILPNFQAGKARNRHKIIPYNLLFIFFTTFIEKLCSIKLI